MAQTARAPGVGSIGRHECSVMRAGPCRLALDLAHQLEDLERMSLRLDVVNRVTHRPFPVDNECGADNTHAALAVGLLLPPDVVCFACLAFRVGQQPDVQTVLVPERAG